ncbi:MAG TPA: ADP compounds hydrolase NudE [Methylococcaceae bacterium]|jgi:ADP-ribose diphosphatase|nr:ADP compounds hydrolase NudE [Methylococcaceae bacterium]HIN68202.1 ADP compounds hydrolase NudE [Methylococcales bacterium]HIA45199.1 ADP compounds hydrolase NudE [Methylococcaceae bacterium]HIB62407.1 ADP compounds hydrolase NudE [Methylococcaceae bacterium]HIO12550.1 ADP compounds hydrolase NudE [Methylococcales bacterium]
MTQKPIIHKKTLKAKSRLFRIEALDLEFSNGEKRVFERLTRGNSSGAVLIVPMLDSQTVLLVREYAAGVERYELGLPKGKVDDGETPLVAANRELKEEVGYGARQLTFITSLSIAPAYLEHMTDIILAEDLYPEKLEGDEPEELEVIPWRLDNLQLLFAQGDCTEARSIAALYLIRDYLSKANDNTVNFSSIGNN